MSALTKIFIVLQVVLAILLVAGVMVFVNQSEDFQAEANTAKINLAQAKSAAATAQAFSQANSEQLNALKNSSDADLKAVNARVADLQQQNAVLTQKHAEDQANLQQAQANAQFANNGTQAALNQNKSLQDQYTQNADALAKAQKQNAEDAMTIADRTNRLEVTERERQLAVEKNDALAQEVDQLKKQIASANLKPEQPGIASSSPTVQSNIPLVGQIQDKKVIDDVPYATINIGSADQVASGMSFYVVDPDTGTFLGTLKVDQVEPHAASGRLDGPHVNDVRNGNQVRTQL